MKVKCQVDEQKQNQDSKVDLQTSQSQSRACSKNIHVQQQDHLLNTIPSLGVHNIKGNQHLFTYAWDFHPWAQNTR